jgi:hypothetical protein
LEEGNHVDKEHIDCETTPSLVPIDLQEITDVLNKEEIPLGESLSENVSCSREDFNSPKSSTYYYLYVDLSNGLTWKEMTHHSIQISSMGLTPFELLDGINVHTRAREDKVSFLELITTIPYQNFSWDEGNSIENVYQTMSTFVSYSVWNTRESYFSSSALVNIVDASGFHHCLEYFFYTMVGTSPCISFNSSSVSQVGGCLKYESKDSFQDNEELRSMLMVMSRHHSFGLSLGINNSISMKILSPITHHKYTMHGSHLVCHFPMNSLHQFYGSNGSFHDIFEAWLEESYSSNVPMNYCIVIFNMVNIFYHGLIFPTFTLFLFQVLFLIFFDEHACADLRLYGWLHWHYDYDG